MDLAELVLKVFGFYVPFFKDACTRACVDKVRHSRVYDAAFDPGLVDVAPFEVQGFAVDVPLLHAAVRADCEDVFVARCDLQPPTPFFVYLAIVMFDLYLH